MIDGGGVWARFSAGGKALIEWGDTAFRIEREAGQGPVVLVCEHASAFIPPAFQGLGLPDELRQAHIAWDPGAYQLAQGLSERLDAPLICGTISRLVYDLNRPPEAEDAVPERSEVHDIPGNVNLSPLALTARAEHIYHPFHAALDQLLDSRAQTPVVVTVHSFTPVYRGVRRAVELGILHDSDSRLADAMLAETGRHGDLRIGRNQPYGPEDGVTHMLRRHAVPRGLLNVMLEIRNDLLADAEGCDRMVGTLAPWISRAVESCALAREAG